MYRHNIAKQNDAIEVVNMDDGKSVDSFVQDNMQTTQPGAKSTIKNNERLFRTGMKNSAAMKGSKNNPAAMTISDGGITQILKET